MQKVTLESLKLEESYHEDDEAARWLASFPFTTGAAGETRTDAESLRVVYNELEPGTYIGTHRDSTEEALLVLEGTVEAHIEEEAGTATGGELVLIPSDTPHSVRNVGDVRARMLGFFGEGSFESVFDRSVQPADTTVFE